MSAQRILGSDTRPGVVEGGRLRRGRVTELTTEPPQLLVLELIKSAWETNSLIPSLTN